MTRMADAMSEIRKARKKHANGTTDPGVENFKEELKRFFIGSKFLSAPN